MVQMLDVAIAGAFTDANGQLVVTVSNARGQSWTVSLTDAMALRDRYAALGPTGSGMVTQLGSF